MTQLPKDTTRDQFIKTVDHVIRERKTAKILGDIQNCGDTLSVIARNEINNKIREAIKVAGWAPFHKLADSSHLQAETTSPVPCAFMLWKNPLVVECSTLSGNKPRHRIILNGHARCRRKSPDYWQERMP